MTHLYSYQIESFPLLIHISICADKKITDVFFDTKRCCASTQQLQLICISQTIYTMNVKIFLRHVIASAFLLFSCVEFSLGLSHNLILGQCSNLTPNRSTPTLTQAVAKQNNKWFSMFRKTDVTLRFPRVRAFQCSFGQEIKCSIKTVLIAGGRIKCANYLHQYNRQ